MIREDSIGLAESRAKMALERSRLKKKRPETYAKKSVSTDPQPRTPLRQRLLLIILGVFLTALLVAAVEGVLALFGVAESERFDDPYVGFEEGVTVFERHDGPGGAEYRTRPGKLKFFNPQSFLVDKAPGTLRIFTLGGSTTAGRPYDDHVSFSRWLERYLDAAEPSRQHEVINAGAISYASYRVAVLMKELVRYEPDVFIVLTGHNEFLEERSYRDLIDQPDALKWLRLRTSRLRLGHLVRGVLSSGPSEEQLPDEVETRLDVWQGLQAYERDDALRQSIVEHFGFNLEQTARLARAHGAEVVFVKPASNLKDFSPFKSSHGDDLDTSDRRRFQAQLAEGQQRLAEGRAADALEALEAARTLDPQYAEGHFRLGQALLAQGEVDAARGALVLAKELDVAPLRALDALSNQVETVARQLEVPWVDLPSLLEAQNTQRLGHGILGQEVFLDHVHPNMETHSLIAEHLLDVLAEMELVRVESGWTPGKKQSIYDGVVAELDDTYYARRDLNLAKVLGWAGKLEEAEAPLRRAAELLEGEADVHLNLGILLQKTGQPLLAAEQLQRAVELSPNAAEAHFNLGVVYGRLGRLEDGARALQTAIDLRPDDAESHHNLSVLRRLQGDTAGAVQAAARAVELEPDAADAYRALGLAHRGAGDFEAATQALNQALERGANEVETGVELAVTEAMAGQLEDALGRLNRLAADFPDTPEVHYNRGRTLAQLGRPGDAMAAYEDALDAAPGHPPSLNNLALLLAQQGRLDDAERHLLEAVEAQREYVEAWVNLGVVYDMTQRPRLAVEAFRSALTHDPKNARVHLGLAMLLWAQGQREDALPHFEAARDGGAEIPPEVAAQLSAAS